MKYTSLLLIVCIYFLSVQNVFDIEKIESQDIENSTFSIRYLSILFPAFIKAMFSFKAFSLVLTATIAWLIYFFFHNKKMSLDIVFPLTLFLHIFCYIHPIIGAISLLKKDMFPHLKLTDTSTTSFTYFRLCSFL